MLSKACKFNAKMAEEVFKDKKEWPEREGVSIQRRLQV